MGGQITDQMIVRFYDSVSGGFFDAERASESLGVLNTARKPFQDSPTPAGNPVAAIALLRMHGYTDEPGYRDKAEATLELLAGAAGQCGLFAATYGIAVVQFVEPHTQIVVVGEDETATQLYDEAATSISQASFGRSSLGGSVLGKSVLKLNFSQAVEANLPPSLAATIPQLPAVKQGKTVAVVCSGGSCNPPAHSVELLRQLLYWKDPAP